MFRSQILVRAALTLVVAVGATGCGAATGGDGGAGPATPAASRDPRAAAVEYAQCMRDHGVNMKDPGDDGMVVVEPDPDVDLETVQAAQEACKDKAPDLGGVGPGGQPDPQMQERMLKFSQCMRDHGVNMPDPGEDGSVRIQPGEGGLNPQSEKFQAAQRACREFFQPTTTAGGGQ